MEENNNYTNGYNEYDKNKEVVTIGDWIITLIVLAIPCVNIIMYFVWAFGNGNESKKNFCKASLIFMAISVVLVILCNLLFGAAFFSAIAY